jgi:hypothetical protein
MPETTERVNIFLGVIEELNAGATASDLDRQLREVVVKARLTGQKGSVTLRLNIEPRGAESVLVSADIKTKAPEDEKPMSIFFACEDGELKREHPKQTTLPFAQATTAATT